MDQTDNAPCHFVMTSNYNDFNSMSDFRLVPTSQPNLQLWDIIKRDNTKKVR